MTKCLILGAGGFMGKSLCKELIKDHEIVAFDKVIPEEVATMHGNITSVEGNFVETKNFSKLLEGVDKVIHLISTTIPQEDTSEIDTEIMQNVIPTVRLLEGMVRKSVPEIIFASSGGTIYGESEKRANEVGDELHPICGYGVQKKVIEAYLEFYGLRHGINYKIMRISNPYGVGQDTQKPQGVIPIFVYRLFQGLPITIYGDGNNERDYIYMPDLVKAFKRVLEYKGDAHIFNIGSGRSYTLNEIINIIEKRTGMQFSEVYYKKSRKCDVTRNLLNVDRTQCELGWKVEIDLEQGISLLLEYYK